MIKTINKAEVVLALERGLADSYALLIKTQNYHWNLTGSNFYSLHKLFEEQYNDLFAAIDELAERIRTLGSKAPGSFSEFSRITGISEPNSELDSGAMLEDLIQSNQELVKTLKNLREVSNKNDDSATEDMAIARTLVHQKNIWLLESSK
jgi:starvation-inducible DNA-binding protein